MHVVYAHIEAEARFIIPFFAF